MVGREGGDQLPSMVEVREESEEYLCKESARSDYLGGFLQIVVGGGRPLGSCALAACSVYAWFVAGGALVQG